MIQGPIGGASMQAFLHVAFGCIGRAIRLTDEDTPVFAGNSQGPRKSVCFFCVPSILGASLHNFW